MHRCTLFFDSRMNKVHRRYKWNAGFLLTFLFALYNIVSFLFHASSDIHPTPPGYAPRVELKLIVDFPQFIRNEMGAVITLQQLHRKSANCKRREDKGGIRAEL